MLSVVREFGVELPEAIAAVANVSGTSVVELSSAVENAGRPPALRRPPELAPEVEAWLVTGQLSPRLSAAIEASLRTLDIPVTDGLVLHAGTRAADTLQFEAQLWWLEQQRASACRIEISLDPIRLAALVFSPSPAG